MLYVKVLLACAKLQSGSVTDRRKMQDIVMWSVIDHPTKTT